MAELGWPMLETTQEHLQNLVSQGYMTTAELATIVFLRILLSHPGGGICRGVLSVLRARIWHASALIPPFAAVVLWLGAASSNSFGDPAYCDLHNLV
jgi:hypothetical protein